MSRLLVSATLALAALGITSPAQAQAGHAPKLRVVECGAESCLRITGHRDDSAAPVLINGHEIAVTGRHRWTARVPVAKVRNWSAPYARSIQLSVANEEHSAQLPIGLLGTRGDLAMLVVSVK
ncbi:MULTISPECIES: hypothetical protein [Pseudomonadota]|uniref:hypothetical protein n=1 Tax=Pseudomonadota TaxID=1224 RepID=UPI00076A75B0|nr:MULTISPECIES: hypothetical protein [Pseudomonadota]